MNQNKVYTHVSLFSGAGGLDIGLELFFSESFFH